MSGGHAVAAVTEAEAPESRRNAGTGEGSPAALARQWPEVSVNLSVGQTTGSWLFGMAVQNRHNCEIKELNTNQQKGPIPFSDLYFFSPLTSAEHHCTIN